MDAVWHFHHLGVAACDIDVDMRALAALGYRAETEEFVDETQGIRGRFLVGPGPRLELLVGLPGSDVLEGWRGRGSAIYHQAYEVADIEQSLRRTEAAGARLLAEPVPATAFRGRRICFLMLRNLMLIELIEATPGALGVKHGSSLEGLSFRVLSNEQGDAVSTNVDEWRTGVAGC